MNRRAFLDRLVATGWLSTVDPGLRDAILEFGRLRGLDTGELFHKAGDERVGMWAVVQGQVGLLSAMNAAEIVTGYIYQPGDWGGYGPLLGSPRQADVVARTPASILFIPYDALQRMLAANPAWWQDIARLALSDVYRFGSWGTDLLLKDSRARTAAILLHLSGCRRAGTGAPTVVVSQSELAEMTNLSRHPIGTILAEFQACGWIACAYRRVDVLNPAALRQMADNL